MKVVINLGELRSNETKRTELPGSSNRLGESGWPRMSQGAKFSGWENVVGYTAQFCVGQGARPGRKCGQKPWNLDWIGQGSGGETYHNSKNQTRRKKRKTQA